MSLKGPMTSLFFFVFVFLLTITPFIHADGEGESQNNGKHEVINLYHKYGDSIELSCDIEKMDRNIKVKWTREGVSIYEMNGKDTKKSQAWTDEEYELDPLTSAIQFKVTSGTAYDYVCKKETKSQTTEKRYYISAIDKVVCEFPVDLDLHENVTYHFNASITFSGNVEPVDKWTIGDKTLNASGNADVSHISKTLSYKADSRDDGKELKVTYTQVTTEESCTEKLSILHPPKKVQIHGGDVVERGSSIECSSNGNPKPEVQLKEGQKVLATGTSKAVYKVPEDEGNHNITISCHAKNQFSVGEGISTTKTLAIIKKANAEGSAPWQRYSLWTLLTLLSLATFLN